MSQEKQQDSQQIRLATPQESDIPPQNTTRWVKSRKLAVIKAIKSGYFTEEKACLYYGLSEEELESWKRMVENHGPDALRATHLKRYRSKDIESGASYIDN